MEPVTNSNKVAKPHPTLPTQALTAEQQRTGTIALSAIENIPAQTTTLAIQSKRIVLSTGFSEILVNLPNLYEHPLLVKIERDVSIDSEIFDQMKMAMISLKLKDDEKLMQFIDYFAPLLKDDLSALKYLALQCLNKDMWWKLCLYLALMNKINPISPYTLSVTAYGALIRASEEQTLDHLRKGRACINTALEICPEEHDLKIVSYCFRKLESPAKAILDGLVLLGSGTTPFNQCDINRVFDSNCHQSNFISELYMLLKDFNPPSRLIQVLRAAIATEIAYIVDYFKGDYEAIRTYSKKDKNLTKHSKEIVVLALIRLQKWPEVDVWLRTIEDVGNRLLLSAFAQFKKGKPNEAASALVSSLNRIPRVAPIILVTEIYPELFAKSKKVPQEVLTAMELALTVDLKCVKALNFLLIGYASKLHEKFDMESWMKLKTFMGLLEETGSPDIYMHKLSLFSFLSTQPELKNDQYKINAQDIIKDYKYSKKVDADFVIVFVNLLITIGQVELALSLSEELYEISKNVQAFRDIIRCLEIFNEKAKIQAFVLKFYNENPKSGPAHFEYSMNLYKSNNLCKALEVCEKGTQIDPSYIALRYLRAAILYAQKEYALVVKQIDRIKEKDDSAHEHFVPDLFDCHLMCNQLDRAEGLIKRYGHLIDDNLKFRLQLLKQKQAELNERQFMAECDFSVLEISQGEEAVEEVSEVVPVEPERPVPAAAGKIPLANPVNVAPAKPEAIRDQKHHFQKSSKKAVATLSTKDRVQDYMNKDKFKDICTIDNTLYPQVKPAVAVEIPTKEFTVAIKLNSYEKQCLENAQEHFEAIRNWFDTEKNLATSNPEDAANYLLPRDLVYHVLKLFEALTPTGKNQSLISLEFESILRQHIITPELSLYLRNLARRQFHSIDMKKLKAFCQELLQTTMMYNIKAFAKGVVSKDKKSMTFKFAKRHTLAVDQKLTHDEPIDYRKMIDFELSEIKRIGGKVGIEAIESNRLYRNGIKLAICAIAGCQKQLNIRDRHMAHLGNKVAHDPSEEKPTEYVNEDITRQQIVDILNNR